jgi:branched-chain amino acid transport system permease protein
VLFCFFACTIRGSPSELAIIIAGAGGYLCGALMEKTTFYPLRKRSRGDRIMKAF